MMIKYRVGYLGGLQHCEQPHRSPKVTNREIRPI